MSDEGIHLLFLVSEGQKSQLSAVIPLAQRALDLVASGMPVQLALYLPESILPALKVPEDKKPVPFKWLAHIQRAVNTRTEPGGALLGLCPPRLVVAVYEERIITPARIYWRIGEGAWIAQMYDGVVYAVKEWEP